MSDGEESITARVRVGTEEVGELVVMGPQDATIALARRVQEMVHTNTVDQPTEESEPAAED